MDISVNLEDMANFQFCSSDPIILKYLEIVLLPLRKEKEPSEKLKALYLSPEPEKMESDSNEMEADSEESDTESVAESEAESIGSDSCSDLEYEVDFEVDFEDDCD